MSLEGELCSLTEPTVVVEAELSSPEMRKSERVQTIKQHPEPLYLCVYLRVCKITHDAARICTFGELHLANTRTTDSAPEKVRKAADPPCIRRTGLLAA